MINLSNYEDWFLLYADGELAEAEQETVLQFVADHPNLQEELDVLLSMRFQPEQTIRFGDATSIKAEYFNELQNKYRFEPDLSIQFPDKQLLYKKTSSPVITMFRYAAVAASVVLTAGLIWWFSGTAINEQPIAQFDDSKKLITPVDQTASVDKQKEVVIENKSVQKQLISIGEKISREKSNIATVVNVAQQELIVQHHITNDQLPLPIQIVQSQSNFTQEAIAAAEARMNTVTTMVSPVQNGIAINTAVLIEAELQQEKPAPARGLLRKISRTLLGEREEETNQKYVEFAVFQIPVKQ